jgi:hypothetical protein
MVLVCGGKEHSFWLNRVGDDMLGVDMTGCEPTAVASLVEGSSQLLGA